MLQFKQSDITATIILTLTENVTISDPYYLFVFTHVLTKNQVKFVKYVSEDTSSFPARYNAFLIDPSTLFLDQPVGSWNYKVYEQTSSTNTDESLTGDILEFGKLILERDPAFEFNKYANVTTYSAYNG